MKISLAGILLPPMHAFASSDDTGAARPVHRVDPEFPRSALRSGADHGMVNARLTLAREGRVKR